MGAARSVGLPRITEEYFTSIFGKRNGTRARVLKHLKGGSFDVRTLKATKSLRSKVDTELELLVFSGMCTASQKLGITYKV